MKKMLALAIVALMGVPALADNTPNAKAEAKNIAASDSTNPFAIEGEVNYLTAYYYRGFVTQDDGLIIQPDLTLSYRVYQSDALTITPFINLWGNLTDSDGSRFDELDVNGGISLDVERFTLTAQYSFQTSPSDTFDSLHEVSFQVEFDDKDVNGLPFALNPHVGFYQEVSNPNKRDEDTYLEFGIAPEFTIDKLPLTFTVPVTIGTSLNHYYEDADGNNEFFGYGAIGITARYDINENFYIHGGVEYLQLFANNARQANGGDSSEVIGTVGLGFKF